jgi:hypothetical protein
VARLRLSLLFLFTLCLMPGPSAEAAPGSMVGSAAPQNEAGCHLVYAYYPAFGRWYWRCWFNCSDGDFGDCDKSLTFEDGPQHTWVYCSYECNSDPDCLANGYINDDGWEIICLMDECTSDCYLNYTSSGIAHWHCAC